jgi:hypothetical protein
MHLVAKAKFAPSDNATKSVFSLTGSYFPPVLFLSCLRLLIHFLCARERRFYAQLPFHLTPTPLIHHKGAAQYLLDAKQRGDNFAFVKCSCV